MDGFILINKEKGMTSHDVVSLVKKKLNISKVGHTGTLDPFARGLLILCIGKATKLSYLFSNLDKSYEGIIQLGKHYDTYDTTGAIVEQNDVVVDYDRLLAKIKSFVGVYSQVPPMYSAIKVGGVKLYKLARKGVEVKREPRSVNIYEFRLVKQIDDNNFSFYTNVSKGTYIRSLAVDLAASLNSLAALDELNRLSVGRFELKDAKSVDQLTEKDVITLNHYFKDYPVLELNDYLVRLVKNGIYLDERQIETENPFIVTDQQNNKIAYYEPIDAKRYKPVLIF